MNKNLDKAIFDIGKAEALMFAIEHSFLDLCCSPEEQEKYNRGTSAFYALWDAIKLVADDLDKLSGDMLVVDAIYAVNDVQRRKSTLTIEE